MDATASFTDIKAFFTALVYSQPRTLAMFAVLPIFNAQVMPGMLRLGAGAVVGLIVAPALVPAVMASHLDTVPMLVLLCKEAFIGFVLGFMVAIPFWGFEAVGFFLDNQRGASIAATLNPLTGNDSSPLGILFNEAFIVFFFISGGFLLMLGILYDSFGLWAVFEFSPTLRPETVPLLLDQLTRLVRMALLLGAPAIVAMFLAELGLALVSRFVPQLQVFFLAMPIKSALAILVLILYLGTLFDYAMDYVTDLRTVVPMLDHEWRSAEPPRPAGATR